MVVDCLLVALLAWQLAAASQLRWAWGLHLVVRGLAMGWELG